jgi:hypothetical protein
MYIKNEGIFDHPPLTNIPNSEIFSGKTGDTGGNQVNWNLIIVVAIGGILIGFGIKLYLDSMEKEKRYSNIEVSNGNITSVDKD